MNHQLHLNETILITIKRLGINGEGIGYYKRLAVFVDKAIPGEVVEVKITELKDKYVKGVITKIKEKSIHRVEDPCPDNQCGGCQIQHIAYPFQLEQKKLLVEEAFQRYYEGDISKIKFYDTIGMDNPWGYRNKASLPVRHDGKRVVTGMYEQNSNHLIFIDEDKIQSELVEKTRKEVLDVLTKANIDVYNPKTGRGSLRYLVIRGFDSTNEVQVTFVLIKYDQKLVDVLKTLNVTSANYSINSDPKAIEIFGDEVVCVKGKEAINGELNNLKFSISPKAFFQLNSKQTEVLYDEIKHACRLKGDELVLDCYCGIGSIGMTLAPFVREVRGIDINREGIDDANKFARMNKIENARFYAGNILPYLSQFAEEGFIPDVLVVDPPRKGLELNFIQYLKKSKIKRIVYVSCNPSTLAKNLNHLQREYSIKYVKPLDMFPQTANVECITLLERR